MTTGCWPLMETWVQVNSSEAANCRPVSSAKSMRMTPTWSLSIRPDLRGLVTWLLSPVRKSVSKKVPPEQSVNNCHSERSRRIYVRLTVTPFPRPSDLSALLRVTGSARGDNRTF